MFYSPANTTPINSYQGKPSYRTGRLFGSAEPKSDDLGKINKDISRDCDTLSAIYGGMINDHDKDDEVKTN